MIWAICAVLTLIAITALIWPLVAGSDAIDGSDADMAVFKDQLAEVEREVARGTLNETEAEAAKIEIQRRLLAASKRSAIKEHADGPGLRAGTTAALAVVVPFTALGIYFALGSPTLPDAPAAARIATADGEHGDTEMTAMVAKLAERMQQNPDDAEGWALLGRSYRQLEQYSKARDAYRRVIDLGVRSADILSDYGEMVTATSNGEVTDAALDAFFAALNTDRDEPRARFYIGMAAAQHGDARQAIAIWRDLTASAPQDAPWLEMVRNQMFEVAQATAIMPMTVEPHHPLDDAPLSAPLSTPASAPANANTNTNVNMNEGQQAAAASRPADAVPPSDPDDITSPDVSALRGQFSGENMEMIQAMVGSLAGRLANEPDDYNGWMMLGRSYMVLRNADGARDAFKQAVSLKPGELEPKQQYLAAVWSDTDLDAPGPLPDDLKSAAEDILRISPNSAEALLIRGVGEAKAGDVAKARATLDAAMATTPPNSPLAAEIARRAAALK
ncbi:MAG: c-type cytochrome biogenesis protein CcmI [Rhodobacteraceae bacterium]|nr:c-type cytochrome biogenesis protein CcmI [Paracoccaceae bacterium]